VSGCPGPAWRRDDARPADCRSEFTVFQGSGAGSGAGRVRAAGRSRSGSCFSVGATLIWLRTGFPCTVVIRAWSQLRLLSPVTVGGDQGKWRCGLSKALSRWIAGGAYRVAALSGSYPLRHRGPVNSHVPEQVDVVARAQGLLLLNGSAAVVGGLGVQGLRAAAGGIVMGDRVGDHHTHSRGGSSDADD
jgi:hypothetical protein